VVYKTIIVHLPVLVPGGLCAPPVRIECPCLVVLRADSSARAKRCRGKGVIVYLHGNGTDIGGTAEEAKTLARELDCHVIVPEYPGYGLAEGVAGEDTVDATTHAAIRFACETMGAPLSRLILYGRSVGTGPAAAAAARLSRNYSHHGDGGDRGGSSSSGGSSGSSSASFAFAPGGFLGGPPAALILHSPYTSIYDYAKEKAGGLLSYLLVSERWPTRTNLRKIRCPTLLIHGDRDEVIPFRHSARLRRDAGKFPAPCQLHVQKGASHNAFDFFGDVADPIASFLRRHEKAPWGAKGEPAEAMELNLRDIERRVLEAGPGEMEDYPFADVPGK
jgi:pimeloyl-ACP methyl ester carboxylesterase